MNALSVGCAHTDAAVAASPVKVEARAAAARSTTWSPIATAPRKGSFELLRRNTPNGRFWTGKSPPGAFADSTQLASDGSCVSLSEFIDECSAA
jgi:hypothetical protein